METFDDNELHSSFEHEPTPPVEPVPDPVPEEPIDPPRQTYQVPTFPPVEPQPNHNTYHRTTAGHKESPFADSPYVTAYPPRQESPYSYQYQPEPPKKQPKPKKKSTGFWKRAAAVTLVLALMAGSCLITAACINDHWEDRTRQIQNDTSELIRNLQEQIDDLSAASGGSAYLPALQDGQSLTPGQLYARCVQSVVAISATYQTSGYYGQGGTSSGSGFILTEDGYVVTNCHVIEGATQVEVVTHEGTTYPAEVVGQDATNDLAVLKVDAQGLPAATLGSSDALVIGDMVAAIGNPLGELTSTQTIGYVSGKDRDVTTDGTIISMIQTDAAINPGNSGGPLFNMRGEVVGITTAKYSGTTGSGASIEGIGFAIPIDDVLGIISDLMDYGYVTGAYLGITVENTDEESAAMFGLPIGAYVRSVESGSAAHRAGIQPKDIIIDLGGHQVSGITTLSRALRNFKAGDTTTITVIRSGAQVTLDITFDERPRDLSASSAPENEAELPEGNFDEWYDYFRRFFD